MDELTPICKNCGHSFKFHESSTNNIWFCDFEDSMGNFCICNEFVAKRATGDDGDEIEVPYTSESYRWN